MTLDGCRLGWRAGLAMPALLTTTLLACVVIEALDSFLDHPSGLGLNQDSGALCWSLARALLKGSLAASAEIAIFRFVLLGQTEDRFVWRPPARYSAIILYGLAIGCALALLIALLPYLWLHLDPWHAIPLALGFAAVAGATLVRSIILFRAVAAEAAVPDDLLPAIQAHWWRLVRMFLWQLALCAALGLAIDAIGLVLRSIGLPPFPLVFRHAAPVLQSVIGPYAFAASFCVLYRSLERYGLTPAHPA